MAAITRGTLENMMPPAYENVRDNTANYKMSEAGVRGDLVTNTAGVWAKTAAGATFAHGILLKPCAAGGVPEVGKEGEMAGFSGLTPYADLYPDGTTAGALSATKPTGGVLQVRAISDTMIAYNFGP